MTIRLNGAKPLPDTAELHAIELTLGINFPMSYLDLLPSINAARPEANRFIKNETAYDVSEFLNVSDIPYQKALLDQFNPTTRLPIAFASCGDYICIGSIGEDTGRVYIADHETPGDDAFLLLADNLVTFLDELKSFDMTAEPFDPGSVISVRTNPEFLKRFSSYRQN